MRQHGSRNRTPAKPPPDICRHMRPSVPRGLRLPEDASSICTMREVSPTLGGITHIVGSQSASTERGAMIKVSVLGLPTWRRR
jgi:hypothetical protein